MEQLQLASPDEPAGFSTPTTVTKAPTLRRGARYSAYANLREQKLRGKLSISEEDFLLTPSPPKKTTTTTPNVCKSVPNLSAALRKENRRPAAAASPLSQLPPRRTQVSMMKTPSPPLPPAKSALRRSGSTSGGMAWGKKRTEVPKSRKSYTCLKELGSFHDVNKEDNGRWANIKKTKIVEGVRRYI